VLLAVRSGLRPKSIDTHWMYAVAVVALARCSHGGGANTANSGTGRTPERRARGRRGIIVFWAWINLDAPWCESAPGAEFPSRYRGQRRLAVDRVSHRRRRDRHYPRWKSCSGARIWCGGCATPFEASTRAASNRAVVLSTFVFMLYTRSGWRRSSPGSHAWLYIRGKLWVAVVAMLSQRHWQRGSCTRTGGSGNFGA
jgi:hypothetical protein